LYLTGFMMIIFSFFTNSRAAGVMTKTWSATPEA
jgi:hypothetical protein